MTPPPSAGLHSWWRTCKKARSPTPGVSPSPLSNSLLSPPSAPTSWEGRGNLRRKQLRFYCRLGIDSLSADCAGGRRRGTPAEVHELPSQAVLTTWASSLLPEKWAPDSSLPPQPRERVSTSKCCICSMPKTSPPLPSRWQGEETWW